jgi:hypothetical protein
VPAGSRIVFSIDPRRERISALGNRTNHQEPSYRIARQRHAGRDAPIGRSRSQAEGLKARGSVAESSDPTSAAGRHRDGASSERQEDDLAEPAGPRMTLLPQTSRLIRSAFSLVKFCASAEFARYGHQSLRRTCDILEREHLGVFGEPLDQQESFRGARASASGAWLARPDLDEPLPVCLATRVSWALRRIASRPVSVRCPLLPLCLGRFGGTLAHLPGMTPQVAATAAEARLAGPPLARYWP